MKKHNISLKQPHIRAKIIGTILIIIGISTIIINTSSYLKLGFASIIIGLLIIFMITERSVPKNISDAQIQGNLDTIKNITKNLNLTGNALFLPKSTIRVEVRIIIPLNKNNKEIPEIDDDYVFSTGGDGKSLGIAVPPSGLKLLKEIEKQYDFSNISIDELEEPLQIFVGMDLLKSVALYRDNDQYKLELEKPVFCSKDPTLCNQYPCPTCSAVLTAITRATNQKIRINETIINGKKTAFHFKLGDK